jgi:hypothetical protein
VSEARAPYGGAPASGPPLEDRAGLPPGERAALATAVAAQRTLGDVLDWAGTQDPPLRVDEVITQDEYTHDVLVAWRGGCWLVYDTT